MDSQSASFSFTYEDSLITKEEPALLFGPAAQAE